jgi:anti-sigma regulatory factor (Ser/Thr protein kinase)
MLGMTGGDDRVHIRREFSASPVAPALARQALDGWLSAMVGEDTADEVRVIASELVANVVRYGGLGDVDKIVLQGTIDDVHDVVRIEVEQPTPLTGAIVRRDSKEFGMGLRIVDGIATEWGLDEGPPGVVWFEVDR